MKPFHVVTILRLLFLNFVLVAPAGLVLAQQRPGIHALVTPPEGCTITESVDKEDLYAFTRAEIQALSFARAGERVNLALAAGGGDPVNKMANITDLRQERIDNTCAGFILSPYTGSKIESVATVAKYLVFAYQELSKMSDEMLGITLRQALPGTDGAPAQLSDWRDRRQSILRNMTDALNLSLSLLIDHSHTNPQGELNHMILTRAQKSSLLEYLNSRFPTLGGQESASHSGDFAAQATMIQAFLAGNYKTAD